MQEIGFNFTGPLPDALLDERAIPDAQKCPEEKELLAAGQSVAALAICGERTSEQYEKCQVFFFSPYTLFKVPR